MLRKLEPHSQSSDLEAHPSKTYSLFAAPYKALPFVFFVLFVLCFELYPHSPIHTHYLRDPDHYMRLNQVVNWLQGQSWYDLSVPRMSPGAHTVVHWSRLIDIPIVAIALPLTHWLSVNDAALAASFVVPFLWLGALLLLSPAMACPFVGCARKNLAILSLLFAPLMLLCFIPGNVDHHGIQVLIAGFGSLSLVRILMKDKGALFAILSSAAFACGFWIGAEILPWTILFMTILGIAAACGDEQIRRHAALFGLCLAAFTTALVPIALPVSEFSSRAVSWFSPAYAIFAALSGAVFVCEWALGRVSTSKLFRLAIASGLAGCAGAVFFFLVPSALNGAYADYDMYDATVALDNIDEARPLINALQLNRFIPVTIFASLANFIRLLAIPLAALGVCFFAAKKERETRTAWIVQTAFLTAAITLTVFWQIRVGKFMEVFAVVPLTYLLSLWNDRIKEKPQEIMVILAQMTVFLLLGPLAGSTQQTVKSLAMDPAAIAPIEQRSSCRLDSALPSLNDPETLGKSPLTIINIANAGPEILFRTPHKVLAGNFNVPGNEDAYNFFSSTKDTVALAIAKKWGAHLVLMCKKVPKFYFGKDFPKNASLVKGENGLLHFRNLGSYRTLVEKLIDNQAPDWLSPVETYGASDYLLYRIEYPKGYK